MEETTAILISQYRWSPPKKCFQELCGRDFLGLVGSRGEAELSHRPMGARLRPEARGDRTGTFLLVMGKEPEEHAGCWEYPRLVPHEPHTSSRGGFGVMLAAPRPPALGNTGRHGCCWGGPEPSKATASHHQHFIFRSQLDHREKIWASVFGQNMFF